MINEIYNGIMKGNICLTGGGGVGKTYITNAIIQKFKEDGVKFITTAMTGLASTHLENGMTLHSATGLGNAISMTDINRVLSGKNFASAVHSLREAQVILIDESSMLRPDTFELVDGVCRYARNELNKPFGGIHIMLVGDFLQLPPVIGREEDLKETWLFENQSWREGNFQVFNLTEVKRQSDTDFINGLNAIRFGEYNNDAKFILKECKDRPLSTEAVVLMSRRKDVEEYNRYRLDQLDTKMEYLQAMVKIHDHVTDYKRVYQELLDKNLEKTVQLKVGARVMITANTPEGLRNGMCGTYLGEKPSAADPRNPLLNHLEIELDNKKVVYLYKLRLNVKNREGYYNDKGEPLEDGFIMQYPIKLAYAITIHKSQGMTLDNVLVDTRGIFAEGQLYVAASRARTLDGLSIMGFNKRHLKANSKAVNFYRSLQ